MSSPNIFVAARSDSSAASVGAVYWPSGHQDWSRNPGRKENCPLSSGRDTCLPSTVASPSLKVRRPKYERTASSPVLTRRSYRCGDAGDQSSGDGIAMRTAAPGAPVAVAISFVPSNTVKRTEAEEPTISAVTVTASVEAWSILSAEMYVAGICSIQTVCHTPEFGV